MDSALEGTMKKLLFAIFLLSIPQTSYSQEIVWGSKDYSYLNIKCSKPNTLVRSRTLEEIDEFKSHYSHRYLKTNLKKIVVCKNLSRSGMDWFRGTYSHQEKIVFVEVGDGEKNDTEYVLHHEFSSIVWLNKLTPEILTRWKANSNFKYDIDDNISSDWTVDDKLQETGALFRYCRTTPENDFNVIAAYYFSDYLRYSLNKSMKKHVRIRAKVTILLEIYEDVVER